MGETSESLPRIGSDPHHDGASRWKWEDGRLWHSAARSRWVECKRVSVTPERIALLASLLQKEAADA